MFARIGLPELVVSDNGQCFVSEEFKLFLAKNGIKQITSVPYHPSSNGLAERALQIIKKGLKKISPDHFKQDLLKPQRCRHQGGGGGLWGLKSPQILGLAL